MESKCPRTTALCQRATRRLRLPTSLSTPQAVKRFTELGRPCLCGAILKRSSRRTRCGQASMVFRALLSMKLDDMRRTAGTATAREPDRGAMAVSGEQRRALRLLAGAPLGATEAIMLAHGITNTMLAALVQDGLATA